MRWRMSLKSRAAKYTLKPDCCFILEPIVGQVLQDDYMDVGGTTTWMWEVVNVRYTFSRANHDYRDIEGRVTPGHTHGCEW